MSSSNLNLLERSAFEDNKVEGLIERGFQELIQDSAHRKDLGYEKGIPDSETHFHRDLELPTVIETIAGSYGKTDEPMFLEIGSGLGTCSLLAAANGSQALGIEKNPVLVEKAVELSKKAAQEGIIADESLCQYVEANVLENSNDDWDFEYGEEMRISDADVVYAFLPLNNESERIYEKIADNMSEDALAIFPEESSGAKENYFIEVEDLYVDCSWVYELDTTSDNSQSTPENQEPYTSSDSETTTSEGLRSFLSYL